VNARVAGGDSGSPVFIGTGTVTLVGILWGGSSDGSTYVFSPLNQIENELGALATF
jgi:V8-like Glu-specific endopeptidase